MGCCILWISGGLTNNQYRDIFAILKHLSRAIKKEMHGMFKKFTYDSDSLDQQDGSEKKAAIDRKTFWFVVVIIAFVLFLAHTYLMFRGVDVDWVSMMYIESLSRQMANVNIAIWVALMGIVYVSAIFFFSHEQKTPTDSQR